MRAVSIAERLQSSVRIDPHTGCHEWTGPIDKDGYGRIAVSRNGRAVSFRAHREAWEMEIGPTSGLCVLHRCDNRKCVNVRHLFLGTRTDNSADKVNKGRQAAGERVGVATLSDAEARRIRSDRRPLREIAVQYKVSEATISRIRNGKTWRHLGKDS